MRRTKDMFMGSLVTILVLVLSMTVFAAMDRTITVTYSDIKLNINAKLVTPRDAQGNTVEPFIYNGTTYLPVRAVAEALGSNVSWDQNTKTVIIVGGAPVTLPPAEPTAQKLMDVLPPYMITNAASGSMDSPMFSKYYSTTEAGSLSMGGVSYKNSLRIVAAAAEQSAQFNLDNKYTTLTGILGTIDGQTRDAMVSFIGDDKVLKAVEVKGGALPQSFSIDLNGIRQLTIKHHGNNGGNIGLAELIIK